MAIEQSLLTGLKNQHQTLHHIVSRIPAERLALIPAPGKWSIHDNITHLAKYQPVFMERIRLIHETDEPQFARYTAETDPEFETWRSWKTERLLGILDDEREQIVSTIENLRDDELARAGIHTRFGKLSIVQWTEFFLLHEAHHIFTVFQLVNDTMLQ